MARWNFVYHIPEEIAEAMEGILSIRKVVEERKEALKEGKAQEFYEGKPLSRSRNFPSTPRNS